MQPGLTVLSRERRDRNDDLESPSATIHGKPDSLSRLKSSKVIENGEIVAKLDGRTIDLRDDVERMDPRLISGSAGQNLLHVKESNGTRRSPQHET